MAIDGLEKVELRMKQSHMVLLYHNRLKLNKRIKEEIDSGIVSTPSATPTRSEVNLQNLNKMMEDWSGEEEKDDDHSDSEGEDREKMVTKHELDGYRLIDAGILNQNTAVQLTCTILPWNCLAVWS